MLKNKTKSEKRRMATKTMVTLALLSAISIILSRFCVIYFTDQLRLSFGNIPIIIAGFLFGPVAGAMVGGVTDIIGAAMMSGYGWYPPLTVTPIIIGLVAGSLRYFVLRKPRFYRIGLITILANLLATIGWSTVCLSWLYGTPVWTLITVRLPFYIGVAVLEAVVIFAMLRSGMFKYVLRDIDKG